MHRLLLLVASIGLASAARSEVRVVSPAPASPYHEIQVAVDAADDGDVILVQSGTYASFAVRNQELVITADAGANVLIDGAIRIGAVGATRTLVIAGLKATGKYQTTLTRHGLYAHDAAGSLRIFGCQLNGVVGPPIGGSPYCREGQGAWFENCADVLLVGCTLNGTVSASNGNGYSDGGHGAFARDSKLTLYSSTLNGGSGLQGYGYGYTASCDPPPGATHPAYGDGSAPGDGLRAVNSFVAASNSVFQGAAGTPGGCFTSFCICGGPGGNGVADTTAAGSGLLYGCTTTAGVSGTTPFVCAEIVVHVCSQACAGLVPGQSVIGSATQIVDTPRRVTATHIARENGTVTLTYDGVPGDVIALEVTEDTGYQLMPALHGVRITQQPKPRRVLQVGTLDITGHLTTTWSIGELGVGVQSRTYFVQATFTQPNGQSFLSSPDVVTLLDSAF